jgi:DNA (cytosine-5)-methyltransferase 1
MTTGSFMQVAEEVSPTLMARDFKDPACLIYDARGNGAGGVSPTMTGDHQNRVTDYTAIVAEEIYPKKTGALCANSHPGSYTGQDAFNDMLPVTPSYKPPRRYIVRRLTPLECCRLQGFPDWWEDGVEGSDSARYKMWGNGIALPCAVDVLGRLATEVLLGE